MKLNAKTIFIAVVVIILIGVGLSHIRRGFKIEKVIDGMTVQLNNGTQVKLIGISNTDQGRQELQKLVGTRIDLRADGSANFDSHLFKGNEVVYAYMLPVDGKMSINGDMLRKGLVNIVEGGCLVDSLDVYRQYAKKGQQQQQQQNVTPQPITVTIDYSKDSLKLPQYKPDPNRRKQNWYIIPSENIDMLKDACDYNLPYTKMFANQLAAKAPGEFSIEQVCEIFDYCYKKWRYVNDPKGQEYVAKASESIAASLTGDCDDFAVLMASCILACGGDACIVDADGPEGGHAYTEVDVNSLKNSDLSYIQQAIAKRFPSYSPGIPNVRERNGHRWLNLDWQAAYPGGKYFNATKKVYYTIIDGKWDYNS